MARRLCEAGVRYIQMNYGDNSANPAGLDHEKLTFKYAGRDFRLTDVHGNVVKPLLG